MGLVVTVDGSWEISDSFLLTSYEIRGILDKRDVILHDNVQTNPEIAYLFEKWNLIENCNN